MKKTFTTLVLGLLLAMNAWASCTRYEMRVDGLACPYCAYGIEKKLNAIDGVENLDVDLNAGIVRVDVIEGVVLSETDMKQLFNDAGFTFRSMQVSRLGQDEADDQQ